MKPALRMRVRVKDVNLLDRHDAGIGIELLLVSTDDARLSFVETVQFLADALGRPGFLLTLEEAPE